MQFAAEHSSRTRTLVVVGSPAGQIGASGVLWGSGVTSQRDRLGSTASNEQVEYWNKRVAGSSAEGKAGAAEVLSTLNLDKALPRITAPTLLITSDRSRTKAVDTIKGYQQKLPDSRLLVIRSDADHVAAMHADECVTNVLAFIDETRRKV
jgi:pimeloyl-ACP methyl ester carboxylesterase